MKNRNRIAAIILVLMTVFALTGCGAGKEAYKEDDYYYNASDYYDAKEGYPAPGSSYYDDGGVVNYYESHDHGIETAVPYGLKMVYTANISIETKHYAECMETLLKKLSACGGYVSEQTNRGGYVSSSGDYISGNCSITARIPAEKLDVFLNDCDETGKVVSLSKSAEDITSSYLDTEARLSSLETQRKRLEELLGQAGSLSELLEVERELASVIYEIESYTSKMNTYKDLVSYSTVYLNVNEVMTYSVTPESFGEQLISTITESWHDLVNFLTDAALFIVGALPWIVVIGLLIFLCVRFGIRRKRKNAEKKATKPANG